MSRKNPMRIKTLYMHTLDGRPAYYEKGRQVVYACGNVRQLATSLEQIRKEQQASRLWRGKFTTEDGTVYGYVRIRAEALK